MNRFLLLVLLTPLAFSQESPKPDFSIIESFSVQAGSVDVVVTDKNGKRVHNLDQNAFSLLVDGIEVPLSTFNEIKRQDLMELDPSVEAIQTQTDATQESSRLGNNYLIFIDDWFTKRQYRAPLLKRLKEEIAQLSDQDRVAIVRYEGIQLQSILPYTSDKIAINKAISKVAKMPSHELRRHTQVLARLNGERSNATINSPAENMNKSGMSRVKLDNRPFVDEATLFEALVATATNAREITAQSALEVYTEQVEKSAYALELAMRGLHQEKGRNNLLLVSEGWTSQFKDLLSSIPTKVDNPEVLEAVPGAPDPNLAFAVTNDGGGRLLNNKTLISPTASMKQITQTANLLGYTLYPMMLAQIDPGTFMNSQVNTMTNPELLSLEYQTRFDSMDTLAQETGGKVLTKAHRVKLPMTQVMLDQQHYYRMTFTLPNGKEGQEHELKVRVAGNYEVRHRKSFRQRSKNERQQLVTQAGLITKIEGRLGVKFGDAQKQPKRKVQLPFELTIPTDWVTVLRDGDHFNVQLELTVAALDKRGNQSPMLSSPITFTGKGNPGGDAFYDGAIMLRNKAQRLVFAIHDKVSNESITKTIDYKP